MRTILLAIGTLLPFVSGGVYVGSMLRGKTKPHRMTRILLALITGLSFFALLANHDTSGIWIAFGSFFESLIVLVVSFKFGVGGRERLDIACLAICLVGLVVWGVTGQSLTGLLAAIIADYVAVIPSMRKTIRLPHTESWLFYLLGVCAAAAVMIAGPYGWQNMLYPTYLFVVNGAFVGIIWYGTRDKAKGES
jgi:hypothetical protein